jgi:DGQHR domain-containing protein
LARLIRRYAKNDLLGELDVEALSTVPKAALAVPALRTSLRGRTAYLFYAKPEALLAISYVARREKGNEQHYQRLIDGSRLGLIGAFLNDRRKKGFFANNVILNFQSKPKFKQLPHGAKVRGLRMGLLRLPRESRAAWIIDGQHRLYGFTRAGKQARDLQVPVIGFQQLSQTKQAELFLEINRHQKAVPPNLIWDLEGEINPNSNFGVISNAVKLLNQVQPFRGMISIPAEARGNQSHLKMGNICDGILDRGLAEPQTENMKASGKNPLYARPGSLRRDRLAKGLRTYFSLCASVLRSDWSKKRRGFFCTNNGLNVLLRVFEASLAYYTHRPSRTELRRILGAVQRWLREGYNAADRLEELRRATSSEGGRADVASKLLRYIEDQLKLSGFAGPRPPSTGLADQAVLLERQLARFIALEMEAHWGADWLRTRTPADVVKRVQERRGRSRKPLDQFITLGECLPIVIREDNWTQIFSKTFGKTFRGKDGFKVKFEDIVSIRNAAAHRPADLSQRDHQLFELYVETFKACMRRRRRRRSVTAATPASGGSDSGQTQQEAA